MIISIEYLSIFVKYLASLCFILAYILNRNIPPCYRLCVICYIMSEFDTTPTKP